MGYLPEAINSWIALMGASCDLALGALATIEDDLIVLDAAFASDGGIARATVRARDVDECARGAAELLRSAVHA